MYHICCQNKIQMLNLIVHVFFCSSFSWTSWPVEWLYKNKSALIINILRYSIYEKLNSVKILYFICAQTSIKIFRISIFSEHKLLLIKCNNVIMYYINTFSSNLIPIHNL